MRVVVALGGNALLERGERPDCEIQERHVARAAAALRPLLARHQLVITHGNGPRVGVLALESAGDPTLSRPYPFDVLGALTQGMIGYWLVQALHGAAPARPVTCLVTRTLVAAADPAFGQPAKFVGPAYDEHTARQLAGERGWEVRRDGPSWRRVVASPEPAAIVELDILRLLIDQGLTVVCAGGGGIPDVVNGLAELINGTPDRGGSPVIADQSQRSGGRTGSPPGQFGLHDPAEGVARQRVTELDHD
jgi:carbamate kinase